MARVDTRALSGRLWHAVALKTSLGCLARTVPLPARPDAMSTSLGPFEVGQILALHREGYQASEPLHFEREALCETPFRGSDDHFVAPPAC